VILYVFPLFPGNAVFLHVSLRPCSYFAWFSLLWCLLFHVTFSVKNVALSMVKKVHHILNAAYNWEPLLWMLFSLWYLILQALILIMSKVEIRSYSTKATSLDCA
jgi:hypothetical protein